MSLRWRLLIPIMLVVNTAFVLSWQVATSTSSDGLRQMSAQNLQQSSANLAGAVLRVVEDTRSDAISTAALDLVAEAIESGDPKNMVFFADQMVRNKPRYTAIVVADRTGKIVASNSRPQPIMGGDVGEPWHAAALASTAKRPVWIAPSRPGFVSNWLDAGESVFGFVLPVVDLLDDRVGSIAFLVSTDHLSGLLDGFGSAGRVLDSFAVLVDASGRALAMPSRLKDEAAWRTMSVGPGVGSVTSPDGLDYMGKESVIEGSISSERWRALVFRTTKSLEIPVVAMSHRLLVVALISISLTTLVSVGVASRMLAPIRALTVATTGIEKPSDYTPPEVKTGDEVGQLTEAFNSMISTLAGFQDGLEEKVRERTRALDARNRDMRRVFENVQQGFITLDREGSMAAERSRVVDEWFGSYEAPTTFVEYMRSVSEDFAEYFDFSWMQLVGGIVPRELALDQLPHELHVAERTYAIEYAVLGAGDDVADGDWDGLLLVIHDISKELAIERAQAEQREFAAAVRALMRDRQGYLAFHQETSRLIADATTDTLAADLAAYKRVVHTIKGNAAIYDFQTVVAQCQVMEDEMAESLAGANDAAKAELACRWAKIDESIAFLEQLHAADDVHVPLEEFERLLGRIRRHDRILFDELFQLRLEPVEVAFARLAQRSRAVAERVDLPQLEIAIEANRAKVDAAEWNTLWSELIHVIRNALDHGLSPLKDRAPKLTLHAGTRAGEFEIAIEDNGVGVDWERVRSKAKQAGLPHSERSHLVDAIFSDGLTTRDEVSELSGRGVGMAAVRERVEAMSGRVTVENGPDGQGTTIRFRFDDRARYGKLYDDTCLRIEQRERSGSGPGVPEAA